LCAASSRTRRTHAARDLPAAKLTDGVLDRGITVGVVDLAAPIAAQHLIDDGKPVRQVERPDLQFDAAVVLTDPDQPGGTGAAGRVVCGSGHVRAQSLALT
jgi:hypothetical protein